jgi:LuxR family transcriptional regulator, quorum-sensing system regulator BjaR1
MRLAHFAEIVEAFDRCGNATEVAAMAISTLQGFGVSSMMAGTMPKPGARKKEQLTNLLVATFPEPWIQRYFSRGYLDVDPTIAHVLTRDAAPMIWSRLPGLDVLGRDGWRVMKEAGDFGLTDGATFSIDTLGEDVLGVSFAGARLDDHPLTLAKLRTVAACVATGLARTSVLPTASLSPRERDALLFTADGLTEAAIAERLGVSGSRAAKLVQGSARKLGAANKTHAVAIALRSGLIR